MCPTGVERHGLATAGDTAWSVAGRPTAPGGPVSGPTIAWAQKILTAPEAYAVLDSETTGLVATSRIVEIAVTTASGTVLLDALLNPGEPIP